MAILTPIPSSELGPGKTFPNFGSVHGWVPVYIGGIEGEEPTIAVRNGYPDFLEPLGRHLWILGGTLAMLTLGWSEFPWKITVKGHYERVKTE